MAVTDGLNLLARTIRAATQPPPPTFGWATVVAGTGEVHVVLDSDPTGTPRPVSDNAAGPVAVGQRVHVAHHGLTLTLLSAPMPSTDVDWTPLTLASGFSGGAWWCIRGDVVYLHGRVVRDAGNWPTAILQFATLPAAALPSRPTGSPYAVYCASISAYGDPLVVAVSSSSGAMSARAGAGVSTDSLELSSLSWPVAP